MTTAKSSTLAQALVAAQAEMPAVEPDAVNPHFKSKFVSLDHLIAKTRPVLNKHGLAITQAPTHIDGNPALATTIYHESGESATDTMPLLLGGSDMQKLGAALTYARRYAWAAALGISSDEDDDGNAAVAPPVQAEQPAAAENGSGVITQAQVKRLWAIAKEHAVGEDLVKTILTEVAEVDSTRDIPRGKYDAVIEALQAQSLPF